MIPMSCLRYAPRVILPSPLLIDLKLLLPTNPTTALDVTIHKRNHGFAAWICVESGNVALDA